MSYTKPTSGTANKLVDAAANATATFTDQSVTNNTPAAQVVSIVAVHPKASPYLADVEFRVTRAPVKTTPLTVTLSIVQTATYLSNTAPTITIPANQTSAVGKYNSSYIGTTAGTVTATVVAGTGYAPATAPANAATVTFAAHPRPLTMSWASDTYTVTEGDTLTAGIALRTRDGAPKPRDPFTIGFETRSGTALSSTATVPNDYPHGSARITVAPGAFWSADGMAFVARALLTVATVEDSVDEGDEQFSIETANWPGNAVYERTCTADHHVSTDECRTFVTITDDDTRGVTLSATTLDVNEGSTGAYTVKLDSQPTASVTVTPSKTGSSDVTFAPASLTFLTSNWSATQTVTVSAAQDSDAADDTATISHAVAGGDYGSVTAASVVVTVDDDETAVTDATAPSFESAAANGTSLVITFDEDLAAAASLGNTAFTVKKTVGSTEETVTLSTTSGPVISGKTVTLTLATALVSTDTAVKVSYTKPTSGTANKLVDAAANATATFTDQTVTNNTPAAQVVTTFISNTGQTDVSGGVSRVVDFSYAQQFTTGGNPGGYTLSAVVVDIRTGSSTATQTSALHQSTTVGGVEVPGTKVVDLTGSVATAGEQSFTPASATTLSASTKYFVVLSISGSTLTIHYTISDDEDSGGSPGWEIANNSLRASNPVSTWTSVSNKLEIAVKGTAVPDTTAPAFASAAANGASLVITFNEDLAAAASLGNSAFTVKKTASGTETTVTLSTTSAPVISGKTVTLTLATALVSTDTAVKVSYTKPTSGTANKLVDAAANATATFTDQSVTNNTPAAQVVSIEAVHTKASPHLADVEFRVTRAPVKATPLTVTLSITQTAAYLFNTAPTITIPADQTSAVGKYNSFYSGTTAGTVTATVVAGTGYAPATAPANAATVTFAAHPRPLTMGWASDTYTVTEGDTLSAGIALRTRDGAPKPRDTFTIGFETRSGTALSSTATVPNDYVNNSARIFVAPAAWSADGMAFVATALLTVATVEDRVHEGDEQFSIQTSDWPGNAEYERTCTADHHVSTDGLPHLRHHRGRRHPWCDAVRSNSDRQ